MNVADIGTCRARFAMDDGKRTAGRTVVFLAVGNATGPFVLMGRMVIHQGGDFDVSVVYVGPHGGVGHGRAGDEQ